VKNSGNAVNKKGFTLLEVLVALAVMAIAVTLLLQLFSADLRAVSRAGDVTWVSVKADAGLKKILDELSRSPVAASWREVTEDGYRMDVSIAEVLMERTDNLPFKLMEVSLTVGWTEGRKEKSLLLRTLKMVEKMAPAEGRPVGSP
jgi:prepilin-type N-terminal cleavage/methylation domain-containing protein